MATVDLNTEIHRITVLFSHAIPYELWRSESIVFTCVNDEGVLVQGKIGVQCVSLPEGLRFALVIHPEKFVELVMHDYYQAKLCLQVNGELTYLESVEFTPELFNKIYDPIKLSCNHHSLPAKLGRVAIFMQAFNEGDMLLYWEAYYGKLVGYENLYVLNNGSNDGSCSRLNEKTNVITMPSGPVDHDHFAQTHGYFLRFLLLKYQWVIKVDTDEFLACEGDLVETLEKTPPGIYCPCQALEVVHDLHNEAPFDFSGSVCAQRRFFIRGTDALIRPIICSEPATWNAGNHYAHERNTLLPGFIVVHLKYFDFDFLQSKDVKWSLQEQTLNESKTCRQISMLRTKDSQALYEFSVKQITDRLAEDRVEIPSWLENIL